MRLVHSCNAVQLASSSSPAPCAISQDLHGYTALRLPFPCNPLSTLSNWIREQITVMMLQHLHHIQQDREHFQPWIRDGSNHGCCCPMWLALARSAQQYPWCCIPVRKERQEKFVCKKSIYLQPWLSSLACFGAEEAFILVPAVTSQEFSINFDWWVSKVGSHIILDFAPSSDRIISKHW